jgi:translation initiation factor 3 subunit I
MRLWSVSTGKCLFTWEFPTAVKRVAFDADGARIVCITEQRMGHRGTVRIFDVNRADGTKRGYGPVPKYSELTECPHRE